MLKISPDARETIAARIIDLARPTKLRDRVLAEANAAA
jgi:hypothetical protein